MCGHCTYRILMSSGKLHTVRLNGVAVISQGGFLRFQALLVLLALKLFSCIFVPMLPRGNALL